MATYNLAGIRNRVLVDKLDDDEFDASIVDNFINDTLRDIYNQYELPFQEKIFEGKIPAGSTMFKLPSDLALMQSQSIAGVSNFHQRKVDWRNFMASNPDVLNQTPGAPAQWTLYGGNILLNAPTDQEYTMTMFYIKKPDTLLQDQDVPDLPYEFEELLVLGAFRRILERNEDYDLAETVESQYQGKLVQLVSRYGFRDADGPIKMKNRQRRV